MSADRLTHTHTHTHIHQLMSYSWCPQQGTFQYKYTGLRRPTLDDGNVAMQQSLLVSVCADPVSPTAFERGVLTRLCVVELKDVWTRVGCQRSITSKVNNIRYLRVACEAGFPATNL